MPSGFVNDPHSQPGSSCPRNVHGFTNYEDLRPFETAVTYLRARELEMRGGTGRFDIAHLQSIHRYLFQDVFPWAGEFRVVEIAKPGSIYFGRSEHITSALTEAFGKLANENHLTTLSREEFARRAAFYLGEINAIHPFREGNGRAQREFIRQLAQHAGHSLSWQHCTATQMIDASIASHTRGDNSGFEAILRAAMYTPD